jgi:hypothetical protein
MPIPTTDSGAPVKEGWTTIIALDGSNNPEYIGMARAWQPTKTLVRAAGGPFVSVAVSTNVGTVNWTAHGLAAGNRVTIAGATVDTDLNGTYVVATAATDSFTITTAAVADATYTEATLTITTNAPSTSDPIWSIQKTVYSGANPVAVKWAEGRSDENQIFLNRATLAYQ